MTLVRLEPAASRSRVKHSTTEPLCSPHEVSTRHLYTWYTVSLKCRGYILFGAVTLIINDKHSFLKEAKKETKDEPHVNLTVHVHVYKLNDYYLIIFLIYSKFKKNIS